jgi:branched-chain amino acid aminotransferase
MKKKTKTQPKKQQQRYCFLNGKILALDDAKVGINDIGILRGYGISDVMKAYGKKVFLIERHLDRFFNSAAALNIKIPYSRKKIAEVISTLLRKNGFSLSTIRMIITGGEMQGGITFDPKKPTFFITVEPFVEYPTDFYSNGVKLISREYQRFMPHVKSTRYLPAVLWHDDKVREGAAEVLYVSGDNVLECSTSNFFIVKDGVLITTKDSILNGITRQVTLELARDEFPIEERPYTKDDLFAADEAFLTATNKRIVPVVKVDGSLIGDGKPGEVTKKLMELFGEYVDKRYS